MAYNGSWGFFLLEEVGKLCGRRRMVLNLGEPAARRRPGALVAESTDETARVGAQNVEGSQGLPQFVLARGFA